MPSPTAGQLWRCQPGDPVHLVWCCGGVIVTLVSYGLLQERLMQHSFGHERFKHSLLLVFINRLMACIFTLAMSTYDRQSDKKFPGPPTTSRVPITSYLMISASNVLATFCQYEALRHVSFTTQTLGKCAKVPAAMVWGVTMLGARFGMRAVGRALGIAAGASLFALAGSPAPLGAAAGTAPLGAALMVCYVAADGFASSFQDRLFRRYGMPVREQVLRVSACSLVLTATSLALGRQWGPALGFVWHHPDSLAAAVALSTVAAAAQLFITATVKAYGAVVSSAALTTRQVCSVALSSLVFGPRLSVLQLLAAAAVFGAGGGGGTLLIWHTCFLEKGATEHAFLLGVFATLCAPRTQLPGCLYDKCLESARRQRVAGPKRA